MFHPTRPVLTAAAALFLFAGLASGQDNSGSNPAQPLGGPKVAEHKIPGVHETFGDGAKDPNNRKDARSIPPEAIKKALDALDRNDAPAEVRLTGDQRAQINKLVADFQASVAAYKDAHKAEMEDARKVLGPAGAGPRVDRPMSKRPGGDTQVPPPKPAESPAASGDASRPPVAKADDEKVAGAKAKLDQLRKNAPNTLDLQTQVWNVLSAPQHAIVQAEMDKWVKAREQEQAHDYVRKHLNKKGGPGDPAAPSLRADGTVDLDTLPPKLKERLDTLTPAEREKALARIRERIKNGDKPDRPGKKGGSDRGTDKPPPPMGDVPVPAPDDSPKR